MADIAINPVTRRVQFTGNTGTGPFAFTFNILADEDIAVYKNTTLLTLTTDYSVTTNANGTGSITLVAGQALISSDVLTIIGGRDLSRTTDFVTAGDLLASSLNEQLDSLVIMTQQLDEKVGRTIKTNPGDVYTDLELPTKDNRKGTVLGFNATSGDPEVGPTIADVSSLASITADIATLADIEDGTDATDAIQTVAGISANVSTVAGISSNVTTVAGITSNIASVVADEADIGTVAGSISNVNTVAGIDSDITTVAGNTTNINTVAGNNSNITTVAGVSANVTTVAGISSDVTTVAGISSDVTTVAADGTDIGTVATNIADVNTVASNIATISAKVSKSGDTMTGDLTIQGNLTVSGTTITVDSATAQTIDLGDGDRMRFGDSNDAYIEWNGTYFDLRSTGRFDLLSSGNDLRLSTATNVGLIVNHTGGTPAVQLYNSGVERLATTSTGIAVTGNATFGDNDKAIFGAGSDLQIYHDGSNSYIQDAGTGSIVINATDFYLANSGNTNNLIRAIDGAQVDLYYGGGIKLTTTSTGVDITGTLTSDGLTVGTKAFVTADANVGYFGGSASQANHISFYDSLNLSRIYTNGTQRVRIDSGGDISFYEDTGTTAKFFWDAAAESLGIGTTTVSDALHIAATDPAIRFEDTSSGITGYSRIFTDNNNAMTFDIDAGNNRGSSSAIFKVDGTEAMRLDASNNLLVGTTNTDPIGSLDSGMRIGDGFFNINRNGASGFFGRSGSDGNLLQFYKDGSTVGSIGTVSSRMTIGTGDVGLFFDSTASDAIEPHNMSTNSARDAAIDIGASGSRFKDLYLSGSIHGDVKFENNAGTTEYARFDSSGNLLVGRTSASDTVVGGMIRPDGFIQSTRDGNIAADFNRNTSDGDIVRFSKGSSPVGSIGAYNGYLYAGKGDVGLAYLDGGSDFIQPFNPSTVAGRDAAIDLGNSGNRFKDLFLSGGVYLGGTGSANKLDDYEEGVFSASMVPSTSGTITLNSGISKLAYTKVGRKVHIQGLIETSAKSSPVGEVEIRNLPFTAVDGEQYTGRSGGSIRATNVEGAGGDGDAYGWAIYESSTTILVDIDASTVHPGGSPAYSQFYISLTYMTS